LVTGFAATGFTAIGANLTAGFAATATGLANFTTGFAALATGLAIAFEVWDFKTWAFGADLTADFALATGFAAGFFATAFLAAGFFFLVVTMIEPCPST
jgi:hypothetical protein